MPSGAKFLITRRILAATFSWHCWETELHRFSMNCSHRSCAIGRPCFLAWSICTTASMENLVGPCHNYEKFPMGPQNFQWDLKIHLKHDRARLPFWFTLLPEADMTCYISFWQTTLVAEWWLASNYIVLAFHPKMMRNTGPHSIFIMLFLN